LDRPARLGHPRQPGQWRSPADRPTQAITTVCWEAEQLAGALGAPVLPLLCVHDTRIPWDEIYVDNVPVLTPDRLLALLRSLPAHMDPVGVMLLAEHARHHLHRAT
jgi:hypothetical protein